MTCLRLVLILGLTQQGLCADNQINTVSAALLSKAATALVITPEQQKQFDKLYNQSINFWGKVVDEKRKPVPGALVKYWILDESSDPEHLPEHTTTTDGQGLFSILGQKGGSLSIDVSKENFYSVASDNSEGALGSTGSFTYGGRGLHDRALPTANDPIIFFIQKKGIPADHLVISTKESTVPNNGAPVPIYLDPADKTSTSKGDLQISASVVAPISTPENPNRLPFNWSATITVVGGGLLPVSNQLTFRAPATGYHPSDQIGFQKDDSHWGSSQEKLYFVKLANNHFCRIRLMFFASNKSLVTIRCYYNQIADDQNLEATSSSDVPQ